MSAYASLYALSKIVHDCVYNLCTGRLGNQMSAYASLYAFSKMYGFQHLVTQARLIRVS